MSQSPTIHASAVLVGSRAALITGQYPHQTGVRTNTAGTTTGAPLGGWAAFEAYGNPELWRHIAEANDIDDPMRLRLGTTVLVVPMHEPLTPTMRLRICLPLS